MPRRAQAAILRGTSRNLCRLAQALRAGQLVGVPTETVYGLAANAWDPAACGEIFAVKERPSTDPLIVHIPSAADFEKIALPNRAALLLAKRFWPGPLTLVLPKRPNVPDIVTAGLPSVAVRVPNHPLFLKLLRLTQRPLAAPSANRFGYVSPTSAIHVRDGLGDRIRYILDGGPSCVGVESTIVDLRNETRPKILRPGAVSREQLEKVLGRKVSEAFSTAPRSNKKPQVAPGQLKRHYSPHTPLVLHQRFTLKESRGARSHAWVFLFRPAGLERADTNIYSLSAQRSLSSAARNLFSVLRHIDQRQYRVVHVQLAAGGRLAAAINDRLQRASAR